MNKPKPILKIEDIGKTAVKFFTRYQPENLYDYGPAQVESRKIRLMVDRYKRQQRKLRKRK